MSKTQGGFFAVDRRTWSAICDSRPLNEAVAYLVLAQGTGASNRITSWSATSLKRYTGISWNRAVPAIQGLIEGGFVRHADGFTRERPRYELPLSHDRMTAMLERTHARLTEWERLLVGEIRNGKQPTRRNADVLKRLRISGVIEEKNGAYSVVDSVSPDSERDHLIWLPNTVITGTSRGEDSPVRRLRAIGDLWALRLFIDLYHAQNLRDDGGISPMVLRQDFERVLVGEWGRFKVWGFSRSNCNGSWSGPLSAHQHRRGPGGTPDAGQLLWDTVRALERQGLLSFVPHLWEHDPKSGGEVIHAYGLPGAGEEPEIVIAHAAHLAGEAMVPDFKLQRADSHHLAPVPNTLRDVQMVGVARLLYRPKTKRTSQWWAELTAAAGKWITHYEQLKSGELRPKKTA